MSSLSRSSADRQSGWRLILHRIATALALPWQAVNCLYSHEGFELSGYMSFTALMALFPFLIFAISLAGFLGSEATAEKLMTDLFVYAPPQVANVLAPVLTSVLDQPRGGLLTFGIVFSVWSASSGVEAFRVLLNRGYEVRETRSVWVLRLQSMSLVVVGAIALTVISYGLLLGPLLNQAIDYFQAPAIFGQGVWILVRYAAGAVLILAALITLHLMLPNCPIRLADVWPGALLTTALLIGGAFVFSLCIEALPRYGLTYGSLGGVILVLVFFYLAAICFAYGAEVNAALLRRRREH